MANKIDSNKKRHNNNQITNQSTSDIDKKILQAIEKHNKKFPYNKVTEYNKIGNKEDKSAVETEDESKKNNLTSATRMAAELVASPLVGAFLGHLFDQKFTATKPLGLAVGFILGVIAAFYSLYKISKNM